MKLKEIDRTANVAWSPANQHPVFLAAGTAAQQLDATFSTTSSLELYGLNLSDSGQDMEVAGAIQTESRFHKLVWGSYGRESGHYAAGLLMAGGENGQLFIWDAAKIIASDDALVHKFSKHSGPVVALDVNPFQINLVASGASESEIFIWDLHSPDKPMTPGAKAQPAHDVACVAWNRQVQHILASSQAGNCIVWDLRKNEPIIKIRDSMSHIKCSAVCWHPDIATQLCIASEDDHSPVIQLWDLRSATSPLKLLECHHRGVLSMAWCPSDSDLLLSCGKDNRILCWNPNSESRTGDVVCEMPTGNQWSFDVQWCPRNPSVISSCSFDGHVSVYSLMGGAVPQSASNKVADAFPLDSFNQPLPQRTADVVEPVVLKKPPKWLRRPCGSSFSFGGKLVSFETCKSPAGQHPTHTVSTVLVSQVVTDEQLVSRSTLLEQTITSGRFGEFCDKKISLSKDETESTIWSFLKVNFESDSRQRYLKLLGYSPSSVSDAVSSSLQQMHISDDDSQFTGNDNVTSQRSYSPSPFDTTAPIDTSPLTMDADGDCDGVITRSLLTANFESAVDVCVAKRRWAEAIIMAIAGGAQLLADTERRFFAANKSNVNDLMWAIVTQKFETVVQTCELRNWKEALAVVLTYASGDDFNQLCDMLGRRLETETNGDLVNDAHLCYIVSGNTEQLVASWDRMLADCNSQRHLQDLIEKVMVLWKSGDGSSDGLHTGHLACRLHDYASLLASQGCLTTALNYLATVNTDDMSVLLLKDRLYQSLGHHRAMKRPFNVVNVVAERSMKQAVMEPVRPAQMTAPRSRTNSANYYQPAPVEGQSMYAPMMADVNSMMTSGYQGGAVPTLDPGRMPTQSPSLSVSPPSAVSKGPMKKYGDPQSAYSNVQGGTCNLSQPMFTSQYGTQQGASYVSPGGPSQQPVMPTGAWNDPPIVRDLPKVDHAPGAPQFEGRLLNPADYQPPAAQHTDQYTSRSTSSSQVSTAVQSGPLPAEHRVLQDVLNQLVQLCTARAGQNPQIKKKLEDVLRKLDALYSRLGSGNLSANTINGLHQIVRAIQSYDYQMALAYHAHVVGAGSFTEISAFMPGLKVLIQTAMQLQVFVQ